MIKPQRKGEPLVFDRDEFPRAGVTADSISKMRPAFDKEGTVTAANASGINDGAAAVILTTAEKAKQLGLQVLATVKSRGGPRQHGNGADSRDTAVPRESGMVGQGPGPGGGE